MPVPETASGAVTDSPAMRLRPRVTVMSAPSLPSSFTVPAPASVTEVGSSS